MITILVVDDHTVFRQGIVSLFDGINDMRVIGETGSGQGAISLAINLIPDVILMDVSLPDMNGITAASHIKQAGLKTELVLLTMYKENSLLTLVRETGIKGYLVKDDAFDDVIYAVRAVAHGRHFISTSVGGKVNVITQQEPSLLSDREIEVLTLITEEMTSKEIAQQLGLSVKTIERHRHNIMKKLKQKNTVALVKYAIRAGLVDLN